MSIRIVRLGSPRRPGEGLRIGTARRPPRGVKKSDYARRDFYDVWLPELSPSQPLVTWALAEPWTVQRLLALLAALSQQTSFSVGCYCENAARCHRSVLRELLAERGAKLAR